MQISFANTSIERLRAKTKTSRGSTVPDWSDPTKLSISGCFVHPSTTGFDQDGRQAISEAYTVLAPSGSDIVAGDHIKYADKVYTVEGAEPYVSPTGAVSHLRVYMERWQG